MSVLDVITLVENYQEIKSADAAASDKARRACELAASTNDLVPCPHLRPDGGCGIYDRRPVACKIWFSASLGLCTLNRAKGYSKGVNPWTDASIRLYELFQEPFAACVKEVAPELQYGGHDFLKAFGDLAMLDEGGLLETLKLKIAAGELDAWDPFDAGS